MSDAKPGHVTCSWSSIIGPHILDGKTNSLQYTQQASDRGKKEKKNQAQVFWVFFLVMTDVLPHEISLYYSLELIAFFL